MPHLGRFSRTLSGLASVVLASCRDRRRKIRAFIETSVAKSQVRSINSRYTTTKNGLLVVV